MNLINKIYNKVGYKVAENSLRIFILIALFIVSKNHIYIDKSFIKYMRIFRLLKFFEKVSITGTGVLIIFYKDKIIKLPLGNHSYVALKNEYQHYLILKKNELLKYVDYSLENRHDHFMMDRLYSLSNPIECFRNIYIDMTCMSSDMSELFFKKTEFINGINCIKMKCGNYNIETLSSFIDNYKTIKTIPMHGDLTKFNIMKNKNGQVVLIDLDRFTMNGIENIDRIHFIIEYYAKKNKKDFFEIVESVLIYRNISINYFYFLLIYFIYRIGAEHSENIILPDKYFNKMCRIIKLFNRNEYLNHRGHF